MMQANSASGTGYCYSCVWAAEMASFHGKITFANTGARSMQEFAFIDAVRRLIDQLVHACFFVAVEYSGLKVVSGNANHSKHGWSMRHTFGRPSGWLLPCADEQVHKAVCA